MSESQLQALLAEIQSNTELRAKFEAATSLDAAEAVARDAGFDVSKAEWLAYQNQDVTELGDEQLEGVAGGSKGQKDTVSGGAGTKITIEFGESGGQFSCSGGGGAK